ncbi:MAG TPA: acetyl-CoA carboxylase biotin carboxyl carrier protein [Longimicrobiaceae bacterium]|nr:acetyl-CoA carboxylase biotin carboxyl carrier protein [Longimicrobiaceae bacterium]
MIDLEFLQGLIAAVDDSGIDSLEIVRGGTRIRIGKTPPASPATSSQQQAPAAAPPPAQMHAPAAETSATAPEVPAADAGWIEVKSPMVGTYYQAPAPEAPPYVETGTRVSKGQTLCILEAMKLMNELESEVAGTVREICVDNAEPVEFGQVLFRIEPDA